MTGKYLSFEKMWGINIATSELLVHNPALTPNSAFEMSTVNRERKGLKLRISILAKLGSVY
jgi:hypothetical protein